MLGVFAQCTSTDNMYADFDWFEYKTKGIIYLLTPTGI